MEFNLIKLHRRNNKRRESSKERKSTPPSPPPAWPSAFLPHKPRAGEPSEGRFHSLQSCEIQEGKIYQVSSEALNLLAL